MTQFQGQRRKKSKCSSFDFKDIKGSWKKNVLMNAYYDQNIKLSEQ